MNKLSLLLIFLLSANAYGAETWTFSSKWGRFSLTKEAGKFYYNGERVQGKWAQELLPVIQNEMNIQCEGLPKTPDLRLTWERNDTKIYRKFYLKQKVASDGKNCIDLTGQGVYYAPYHSAWFAGDKNLSLNLTRGFEIGSELETWAKFEHKDGRLAAESDFAINWETTENLINLFKQFPIDGRAHPDIMQDPERDLTAKNVVIKTGGKTFAFRQIKGGTWLMKMPNVPWLVLSSSFGLFDNMSKSDWRSQYNEQILLMKNTEAPEDERVSAVNSLRPKGSKDVFNAYHDVLLDSDQNEKVKSAIVTALRFYPSEQNMKILAQAMNKTESTELIYEIIKVLKLRNPKGPQIDPKADAVEVEKAVREWGNWARKL